MQKRLELKFYGAVQGVGLRRGLQIKAGELGLVGWVKNCPEGAVEAVVEGLDHKLQNFLSWCYNSGINIDRLETHLGEATNEFNDFKIVY